MNDSALTLSQVKADLGAKIDRVDVKIDTVKADLETKIDRLDVKIDTVKMDLEAKIDRLDLKIDDRTEQILAAVRETAELIDARQDRRRQADLWAFSDTIDDKRVELRSELLATGAALDEHVRDDTRHLQPAAARGPKPAR